MKSLMKTEIIKQLAGLITAAFGLVAALAWNDTIALLFKEVFGQQNTLWAMLTYSLAVTVVAVIATVWIGKVAERVK